MNCCKKCNKETKNSSFCSKSCANSYNRKFKIHSKTSKNKTSESLKKFYQENGIRTKTKEEIQKISETKKRKSTRIFLDVVCDQCSLVYKIDFKAYTGLNHRHYCSRKCSDKNIFSPGFRYSKKGWYKGYWCDSSYELVWVIYNLDHNIKFERNYEGFEYVFENKQHKYYPDFILEDGSYVEIKGRMTKKDEAKLTQFLCKIIIIDKKDISKYFSYVENKYGTEFIKLYDKNNA